MTSSSQHQRDLLKKTALTALVLIVMLASVTAIVKTFTGLIPIVGIHLESSQQPDATTTTPTSTTPTTSIECDAYVCPSTTITGSSTTTIGPEDCTNSEDDDDDELVDCADDDCDGKRCSPEKETCAVCVSREHPEGCKENTPPEFSGVKSTRTGSELNRKNPVVYMDLGEHLVFDADDIHESRTETPNDKLVTDILDKKTGKTLMAEVIGGSNGLERTWYLPNWVEPLLPTEIAAVFQVADDGRIINRNNDPCINENIGKTILEKQVLACPMGDIDLGKHYFVIESKHTRVAEGLFIFRVRNIGTEINPIDGECGWPELQTTMIITHLDENNNEIGADEDWVNAIYLQVKKKIPTSIKGFKIEDFLPPAPNPDGSEPYDTGREFFEDRDNYKIEVQVLQGVEVLIVWSSWSYMEDDKTITGSQKPKNYKISKQEAEELLNGFTQEIGEDGHYTIIDTDYTFKKSLYKKIKECCPEPEKTAKAGVAKTKISKPSTYLVRTGGSALDGSAYYFGPQNVSFSELATVTLYYDNQSIPDTADPVFYRYEDDYIDGNCQTNDANTAYRTIGPSGGTINSNDGNYTVEIPAGALNQTTRLFISNRHLTCQITPDIACTSDDDCGTDDWNGNTTCGADSILRYYTTHTCKNSGTVSSHCTTENHTLIYHFCGLNQTCANGECQPN